MELTRRTRARLWLLAHLPAGLLARPAEWFIAYLCVLSSLSLLVGLTHSDSLNTLPPAVDAVWAACLLVGSAGLACGLSSIRETSPGLHVVTRVPCYMLGLRLLLVASVVYGLALAHRGDYLAAPSLAGFAVMCGLRLLTLAGRTRDTRSES